MPGYFDTNRRTVAEYLGLAKPRAPVARKDTEAVRTALQEIDLDELEGQGVNLKTLIRDEEPAPTATNTPPVCERCHRLIHYNEGEPIYHPSVDSLRDTILESPYKYNYVYHVIDAADFPMSLLPRIDDLMEAMPLRSQNRRSRNAKYFANKKTEVSFVITRSDLLGPRKEDVDHLMPWIRQTLRDALGRRGHNVRLGSVRCVSAKRSWWTRELKEEIFKRGGAAWMVGKANVGKSNLYSAVFPKGRMDEQPNKDNISVDMFPKLDDTTAADPSERPDEFSLLPPLQPETPYPAMPLVSSLPGTTASPIRLSFGGGKGELIDLPGLPRSDLESFVQEKHRHSLIMKKRITPEQRSLKPGESLLLGGFIRITPRTPDVVFLACNFTPLQEHVTTTEKAIRVQTRTEPPKVQNISVPEASEDIRLAGSYELSFDVTKERAGPLTRKNAFNMAPDKLPFRILATDILIEGVGWVEVVAEVRRRHFHVPSAARSTVRASKERRREEEPELLQTLDLSAVPEPELLLPTQPLIAEEPENEEASWPVVDVFTPKGRFVSSRRPMNGWEINKPKKRKVKTRPRRSMKKGYRIPKQA